MTKIFKTYILPSIVGAFLGLIISLGLAASNQWVKAQNSNAVFVQPSVGAPYGNPDLSRTDASVSGLIQGMRFQQLEENLWLVLPIPQFQVG